jgi:Tfp pilus assembly protein PilF
MEYLKKAEIDNERDAHYDLGISYLARGDKERALAEFSKAILDDAGNILAHFERGKMYLQRQEYSQAVEDFSWVVDYERQFNNKHGILDEAETDLEKAKKLSGG